MAAAQTAADKAAQEAAEAEKAKAAPDAEAEKAKAAADGAGSGDAKPATTSRSTSKGHIVTGAAVVLKTTDGSERYLYRGATIPAGAYDEKSVKHALSIGLIEKAK